MPKSMKSMMDILYGPNGKRGRSCPDCESPMESDGTCSECGCGEGYEEEEEDDSEEEDMHRERMLEIRDDLQRLADKLSKLAGEGEESEAESENYMLPTVFAVRKMVAPK